MTKTLKWLALALLLVAPVALSSTAQAAPLATPDLGLAMAGDSNTVEVAVKCGPRAYYKKGFRAKNGEWVKGRCIKTKAKRR